MARNRRYANYPGAQRAPRQPKAEEAPKEDENPTLRGHALTVAGKLYVCSQSLLRQGSHASLEASIVCQLTLAMSVLPTWGLFAATCGTTPSLASSEKSPSLRITNTGYR